MSSGVRGGGTLERTGAPLLGVAFILVLGTFMASLDATIVAVGIDTLVEEFDASVADIQWVTTAYLLAIVTVMPMSGWLADRFGGRRTWLTAVAVFLLGSVACAVAWSVPSLVVFRVLQGLGGGLLPPTGQALLARVAGPERIGRIISVVSVVPLLSPVLGPLIGGSILSVAEWPWLFLVNIPIGLVAMVLAWRYVPVVAPTDRSAPFDVRGAMLLPPGLAVLVFGLTELADTGQGGTFDVAIVALAVGVGMLVAFGVHGMRSRRPALLDVRLFTRPPFGAAATALLAVAASVFGTMFLLPLFLQAGRGLSAWEAGLLLAPQGVGAAVGALVVSRIIGQFAPRTLVLTGMALIAIGTVPFTQLPDLGDGVIAVALLVRGMGSALIGAPTMNIVYSRIEATQTARASSALNLMHYVGGSLGTAVLAVVLQTRLSAEGVDVTSAFAGCFWWVLGLCVVAALWAVRLPRRVERARSS
ncbi:DHA2 family efflux MFS transporter permease subunit [Saccharomonospora viridis]|jgi:EmrB/QacA subfamily drug resistance transporter|uniref:Drug resistance transporter, EmrB/QacA subfamily n=4 Tax=Saccharomonospora viridis TaxID=1852 RepID=C7MVZ0_SACVD|nr:DHA2 family efflux MFS transporter permease subunit [Saccharomonospora viridis]ACU97090.1 drug resistance transporter, EmrB/QacA subfamily [Saccharomonospora viridis DSM 43017]SFO80610.1 drug resistance transporter, EmrB/QacA subfamily [Saccharomonospora viridis]